MIEKAMQIIDPTFKPTEFTRTPKIAVLDVKADEVVWNCIHQALQKANLQITSEKVEHFEAAYDAGMQIINYENWQAFGELTQTGLIGSDVNNRLLKAAHTTLEQVQQAESLKVQLTQELDALLDKYDALVLPTLPQIPPKVSEAENTVAFLNLTSLVRPFNLSVIPLFQCHLKPVKVYQWAYRSYRSIKKMSNYAL